MKRLSLDQVLIIQYIKLGALVCSFVFFCYGFFKNGQNIRNNEQLGYFLIDSSQSMLVQDSPEKSSRLTYAKKIIQDIVLHAQFSTQGASIFAGETQIISPLSSDQTTFLNLVAGIHHERLQQQGSALEDALHQTKDRFMPGSGDNKQYLILISDGGDDITQLSPEIIDAYKYHNIQVLIVGVGSESGGPIVMGNDAFGQINYKIYQGKPVIVTLNQENLESIATQLGGKYIHINNNEDIQDLIAMVNQNKQPQRGYLGALFSILIYLLAEYYIIIAGKKA